MNPDPSIKRTWRGAADCGASGAAGRSASAAADTSFIAVSRSGTDLARRRALALTLTPRLVRRLRYDADLLRHPAGLPHRPVDEPTRAVRALYPTRRRQIQIDARMPERPAPAVAGRDHFADLDRLERGHFLANESVAPMGVSPLGAGCARPPPSPFGVALDIGLSRPGRTHNSRTTTSGLTTNGNGPGEFPAKLT